MGAKESKQSCISYEDASKRITSTEMRRLREAFKKSAGAGQIYLSRNAFQQDVLFEGVPPQITDLLFSACGGTNKGILFKDLLCGLVLLTHGTEKEKIKFLFNLYSADGGYIYKPDYIKSVDSYSYESVSLFLQGDKVYFEQYYDWILKHKQATMLSKWLLTDVTITLTSELETPTFYQSLAGVTHLEEKDICDLEKEFWQLKNESPNSQLDLQFLGPLISPPIPKNALIGLFNAFDENRDGHIDFKELCCGVSAACRGPIVERTRFCFKIFDIDRDGVLNEEESQQMINVLLYVAKEGSNSQLHKNITKGEAMDDFLKFAKRKQLPTDEFEDNKQMQESRQNIVVTAEEFMMWSVESTLKIVQPFLDLTFELCHIVFGLSPQCKHMEYEIVRGWLQREQKREYRVGQFWYLISREWWQNWIFYTHNSGTPCDYCRKNAPGGSQRGSKGGIDEALVCDESFNTNSIDSTIDLTSNLVIAANVCNSDNTSIGSTSSGISTGRQFGMRPGPIDNTNLITPNAYSNVQTLTGEGGHLKRDPLLVQGRDFELVPKSLWKALNRWYVDELPLPRQVIQPPDTEQVELELYPLNLRVLLHQNTNPNQQGMNNWGNVSSGYGVMASGGGYAAISASTILSQPKRMLRYTAAFSRLATIRQIGEFLCDQLRLRIEDIRLWYIPAGTIDHNAILLLEEDNMTLKDLAFKDNDQILLEKRNKDLTWPEELGSLVLNQGANNLADRRLTRASIMSVHAPGATGLHNLGNTCFMNAALQVLFNTQPLAQYFHRNMHLYELNTLNKLGTRGQLATRYAELLKEVWTASTRSIAPLKLRFCVTKHAPQFAGGGQHDSQELLEWFLDALHEDLNRVMEKPYSELKDSNGRPDKIVASEAWAQHNARNQSIVIDLFYGQLKSKVSCLCCGRESVRFDPFSLLSLPLPVENYVYFEVLVVLLDGSVPVKYGLRLNSESKYFDMKLSLSELCNLDPYLMLICEVRDSQIRLVLTDDEKVKPITAKELFVYQLPEENNDVSCSNSTLGINIEKGLKDIQRNAILYIGQESGRNGGTINNKTNNCKLNNNNNTNNNNNNNNSIINNENCAIPTQNDHQSATNSMNGQLHEVKHSRQGSQQSRLSAKDEQYESDIITEQVHAADSLHLQQQQTLTIPDYDEQNSTSCENSSSHNLNRFSSLNSSPDIDDDDEDEHVTTKQSTNMSHSPENTFVPSASSQKRISASNLLYHNCQYTEQNHIQMHNLEHSEATATNKAALQQRSRVGKYLIAVHRKITRQDSYFLSYHKTRPSLFGDPLLIPNCEGGTHKDLYCAVWLQVGRLLSPLPASTDQANHAADCDDSLGYDFPFTLRAVRRDGMTCALCPWSNFCRGCEIPCNNDYLIHGKFFAGQSSTPKAQTKFSSLPDLEVKKDDLLESNTYKTLPNSHADNFRSLQFNFTIAIDWDPTALHLRYNSTREKLWINHETVATRQREQTEPVDLNDCLRAFTSVEKLEQWYHCSHCKGKKPATKKLQIWKLPPILIVHLKRFNCMNGKWVKSQKAVNFPFDDFDPTPYLASVPQETILRHRELLEFEQHISMRKLEDIGENDVVQQKVVDQNYDNEEVEEVEDVILRKKHENLQNIASQQDTTDSSTAKKEDTPPPMGNMTRKRLVSTSLLRTPIIDGEFEDFHQHKLKTGQDKFDPKYKLYAVVSHSGMLNGGHYISYAANQNGCWYCYNDSSCREISSKQPHIDPSSAYLLFYERKGLDYEPYLPTIDGRSIANSMHMANGVDMDDSDGDFRKQCALS